MRFINMENHRNISSIKYVLSHFRPVSHLRDIRFRQFFQRLGYFLRKEGLQNNRVTNCKNTFHSGNVPLLCLQGHLSHFGNSNHQVIEGDVPVTPQRIPVSHTHFSNVIRCVPLWAHVPLKSSTSRVQNQMHSCLYIREGTLKIS